MFVLQMFLLGMCLAMVGGLILDSMKQKAYWAGRRAGYARGIADSRHTASK